MSNISVQEDHESAAAVVAENAGGEQGAVIAATNFSLGSTLRLKQLDTSVRSLGKVYQRSDTMQSQPETSTVPDIKTTAEANEERNEEEKDNVAALNIPKPRMPRLSKRKSSYMSEMSIVKRISREDIRLVYTMERVLGSGNFGTARLAHKTGNQ